MLLKDLQEKWLKALIKEVYQTVTSNSSNSNSKLCNAISIHNLQTRPYQALPKVLKMMLVAFSLVIGLY